MMNSKQIVYFEYNGVVFHPLRRTRQGRQWYHCGDNHLPGARPNDKSERRSAPVVGTRVAR